MFAEHMRTCGYVNCAAASSYAQKQHFYTRRKKAIMKFIKLFLLLSFFSMLACGSDESTVIIISSFPVATADPVNGGSSEEGSGGTAGTGASIVYINKNGTERIIESSQFDPDATFANEEAVQ